MKNLRFISFLSLALLLGSTLYLVTSCNDDPCKDVICLNGGTATASADNKDCTCACPTGYEGEFCGDLSRDIFIGSYNGTESCDTGDFTISVAVTAGAGGDLELTMENLYDAGFFTTATVNASGGFDIALQTFGTGQISGSGAISGGILTINYQIAAGGATDNCTFTSN